MVIVRVDVFDPERRVALAGFIEATLEFSEHIRFEYFSSTFRTPDDMVLVLVGRVIKVLNPHVTSVSRSTAIRSAHSTPYSRGQLTDGPCGVSW